MGHMKGPFVTLVFPGSGGKRLTPGETPKTPAQELFTKLGGKACDGFCTSA